MGKNNLRTYKTAYSAEFEKMKKGFYASDEKNIRDYYDKNKAKIDKSLNEKTKVRGLEIVNWMVKK